MTALNKKKKCSRTYLDRGGEKGPLFRLKRDAMYHKKDRVAGQKMIQQQLASEHNN